MDAKDPGKVFLLEVATSLKSHWPARSANEAGPVPSTQSESDHTNVGH